MKRDSIAEILWGQKARLSFLIMVAVILLFTFLGSREIWTQEHRWADIVSGMFFRHDFLHPYLGENTYYDKPLLSYWLMAAYAALTGELTTWALRFPSALSGVLAIWSIYRLGTVLKSRQLGMLSGWMLLTTFYFLFWARTSSADMLNMAGSLFAVSWYFDHKNNTRMLDYTVFFLIVALTSLCKGLVGAIVPMLAVFIDISMEKSWKQHLNLKLIPCAIPALIVYLTPFWLSSHFGGDSYGQDGLYMVFRENVMRYFQPFDHKGPIYTYLIYLPVYLLPWAFFFIPALFTIRSRWQNLNSGSRWIAWTTLALFLFFSLSGSRRSYYVLPIVPFAILFTADWILTSVQDAKRRVLAGYTVILSALILCAVVDVLPAWYYSQVGVARFASELKIEAEQVKPWKTWNVVMLDAESKLNFYLQLPPSTPHYGVPGSTRQLQTAASLQQAWPVLINKPQNTIFITRKQYVNELRGFFAGYQIFELPMHSDLSFMKKHAVNAPVAFIPVK